MSDQDRDHRAEDAVATPADGGTAQGATAAGSTPPADETPQPRPEPGREPDPGPGPARRRDPVAAALIGLLTLLLGFAFAVQVRSTDTQELSTAREEDLVRILDNLNSQEDRLREQIADQRGALDQLTSSDSRSATALEEARRQAEAIGILNGTVAAQGPGLSMLIDDPEGEVRVADVLDAI